MTHPTIGDPATTIPAPLPCGHQADQLAIGDEGALSCHQCQQQAHARAVGDEASVNAKRLADQSIESLLGVTVAFRARLAHLTEARDQARRWANAWKCKARALRPKRGETLWSFTYQGRVPADHTGEGGPLVTTAPPALDPAIAQAVAQTALAHGASAAWVVRGATHFVFDADFPTDPTGTVPPDAAMLSLSHGTVVLLYFPDGQHPASMDVVTQEATPFTLAPGPEAVP